MTEETPNDTPSKIEFTSEQQEKINQILADERRKHETRYESLLQSQSLTQQEREQLESDLENLRAQSRTKEQQAAAERKRLEEEHKRFVESVTGERDTWKTRYESSTINRELLDAAASNEAYNANQIVNLLKGQTKMVETKNEKGEVTGYEPFVDFEDVDPESGKPVQVRLSPADAVKRMKELPDYQNLFKSGVVPGLGQNSATGGHTPGKDGTIDVTKLTQAQYAKIRRENPALLGL